VSRLRIAFAFLLAPFGFVTAYWLFLLWLWGGGGYAYEGLGALLIGYPVGFALVLMGGVPLLFWRLPTWLEVAVFVLAGIVAALLWIWATRGRLGKGDFQFFELCAVSSGLTYPLFIRLAALRRAP